MEEFTCSEGVLSGQVYGTPIQQGSMQAFPIRRANGTIGVSMVHTKGNKLTVWRENIRRSFLKYNPQLNEGAYFKKGTPVNLSVTFSFVKPKSNKLSLPCHKMTDLDKLIRAVGDALSGIAYDDDCQIVSIYAGKKWAESPEEEGAYIRVEEILDDEDY